MLLSDLNGKFTGLISLVLEILIIIIFSCFETNKLQKTKKKESIHIKESFLEISIAFHLIF